MAMKAYTIAQKAEQGRVAWEYSTRGYGVHRIGREMGLAVNTVQSRIREYEKVKRDLWDKEDIRAVATYEEVIRKAWQRYDKVKDHSLNASGLLNTIITARKAIDDITGARAPTRIEQEHIVTDPKQKLRDKLSRGTDQLATRRREREAS
jgi:hypothetical protein